MKATTYDFAIVGSRMREARRVLKLSQVKFYDNFVGIDRMTLRTFQRAESGANEAGITLIDAFVRAGINANWLLTGEGAMLLAGEFVAPDGATSAHSKDAPASVDSLLLQRVVEFFYAWIDEHADYVRIDRSRHGAIIAILYRIAAASGKVVRDELEPVIRLAA